MENAKLTCPDTGTLRALGAALAAGEVSREHVDVGRCTLKRLPVRVVRERRDEVDGLLTEHARRFDPAGAEHLARHLLSVLAPDRADRYDENALDRRHLSVATDQTGMVLVSGQLDQVTGLKLRAVLDHVVETDRAARCADGAEVDVRTRGQRRVDALGRGRRRRQRVPRPRHRRRRSRATRPWHRQRAARAVPRVVVVTTPEQLAGTEGAGAAVTTDGDLVGRGALTRIACDAVIDRVVLDKAGRVLAMDTIGRLATAAQQTALAARDQGCVWPGCTTPPSLCEAHHVVWWSRGGPTTIDNLALLCHRHHSQIHAQPEHDHDAWVMVMSDGVPWFRPPERLDPDRRVAAQHLPPDRPGHPRHRPALAHAPTRSAPDRRRPRPALRSARRSVERVVPVSRGWRRRGG